jgi:hypothetical protein
VTAVTDRANPCARRPPAAASAAGWWDRYQDRKDIRHDYADIRHDLLTGHFADAFHDLRDVRHDRRDLFWGRLGF